MEGQDDPGLEVREADVDIVRPFGRSLESTWPVWLNIAAALVTVAILTTFWWAPFRPVGDGAANRWRGPVPEFQVRVDENRQANTVTMSWRQWPGATEYRLMAWDEDGVVIVQRYLNETATGIERPIRADGSSGSLLVAVEALVDGIVVATASPVQLPARERR